MNCEEEYSIEMLKKKWMWIIMMIMKIMMIMTMYVNEMVFIIFFLYLISQLLLSSSLLQLRVQYYIMMSGMVYILYIIIFTTILCYQFHFRFIINIITFIGLYIIKVHFYITTILTTVFQLSTIIYYQESLSIINLFYS